MVADKLWRDSGYERFASVLETNCRLSIITGLDYWNEPLDWTTGMNHWNGLLD